MCVCVCVCVCVRVHACVCVFLGAGGSNPGLGLVVVTSSKSFHHCFSQPINQIGTWPCAGVDMTIDHENMAVARVELSRV